MAANRGRPTGSGVVWPSAKTVYALRACAVLAAAYPDRRLKAAEIAKESKVPLRFLSRILGEMRNAEILGSRRGYQGGYVFERDPSEITVAELTLAISGYELFAPVPADRFQPGLPFVDELQRRLREVASDAFGRTSIAEIATYDEPPPA
jgi:Rrf2 family protein